MATPPFTADATLTAADLAALDAAATQRLRAALPTRRPWREALAGLVLAILGALAAERAGLIGHQALADEAMGLAVGPWHAELTRAALGLLLAFALGMALMARAVRRRIALAAAARLAGSAVPFEPREARIDADGVTFAGPSLRASWSWPALSAVETRNGVLVFHVGTIDAVGIPLRGFATEAEAAAARAFAQARIAASR
jgi:hypothetical protein